MLKKVISASLTLALLLCVNLPVKASEISNNMKTKTVNQAIESIKDGQAKDLQKNLEKKTKSSHTIYSLSAQPFYVALYSDGNNSTIYSRNQAGTIAQDYFPLIIETYQKGAGIINEVKVDGRDISQVYTESDFYNTTESTPAFFVVEKDPTDSSNSAWYTYVAVSTLSKGTHTVQIYSTINGKNLSDSIRVTVS
ncbi:hypothetical protein psyc5s11_29840 [Clostridium gelidum]|uniref:Uncharacterized protein n=1 Tax=Clostridium gelidum TaxID=704125 RepID=A0ABM7TD71_9CLOT|nr:hypothetical protein [Clostridium gelidum]BCZ46917.1 hypothetical protein psyc5s11_29840 [Clostridium gelidum]